MGGKCPYSCCFVGCCFQDLFNIALSILVQFSCSLFPEYFVRVHVMHPFSRINMTAGWKKLRFILLDRSYFHMINNLSIAVHASASCLLMSFSVDEMLLPRYVNLSINFKEPSFRVKMSPFLLKHMYSVLSAFTWSLMPPAACSRLQQRCGLGQCICQKYYIICVVCIHNSLSRVSSASCLF